MISAYVINATDADAGGVAGCTEQSSRQCRLLGWQFPLALFSAVYPCNNSSRALRYLFSVPSDTIHTIWAFNCVYTLAVSWSLWTPCCDIYIYFFQCHHMSLMNFVVSPPGCGWSVTDFLGWDAHEAQLRCPDEMDGDIWIWSTRRGLKPKVYEY
jgi:hypothetical protein